MALPLPSPLSECPAACDGPGGRVGPTPLTVGWEGGGVRTGPLVLAQQPAASAPSSPFPVLPPSASFPPPPRQRRRGWGWHAAGGTYGHGEVAQRETCAVPGRERAGQPPRPRQLPLCPCRAGPPAGQAWPPPVPAGVSPGRGAVGSSALLGIQCRVSCPRGTGSESQRTSRPGWADRAVPLRAGRELGSEGPG